VSLEERGQAPLSKKKGACPFFPRFSVESGLGRGTLQTANWGDFAKSTRITRAIGFFSSFRRELAPPGLDGTWQSTP